MQRTSERVLRFTALLLWLTGAVSGLSGKEQRYLVLEVDLESKESYAQKSLPGLELTGAPRGARRRVPALSQWDLPEPTSACGPVAMLNWLLWLDRYRVLKPAGKTALPINPAILISEIEETFREIRGKDEDDPRGGTHPLEIAVAMDRIVNRRTDGALRLSPKLLEAPVKITELMQFMRGYRCGMLITRIVVDEETKELGEYHAVNFVAADRRGGLMVNNWGKQVYGFLRNEPDGQFFRSENAEHPSLKVDYAICLLPFRTQP